MAKENDIKMKFLELRAKGLSYDKISKEIGVSKSSLISWSKDLELEIQNLRNIEHEAIREQFMLNKKQKLEYSKELFEKLMESLKTRNFDDIPSPKLVDIVVSLMDKLEDAEQMEFTEKDSSLVVDFSKYKSWTG